MLDTSKSPLKRWIVDHLDYPHEEYCLIWPFGTHRKGYPAVMIDGRMVSVHRLICEMVKGPPPEKHVAAHSCDRGHEGCVNPRHLSWKTGSANQLDRADGKGNRKRTKLTPDQVLEIRGLKTLEPIPVTADRYGVSESAIRQIQTGKTWGGGDRRRTIDLTTEQVLQIRRLKGTKSQTAIARELGLNHSVVWRVLKGKAYTYVTETIG